MRLAIFGKTDFLRGGVGVPGHELAYLVPEGTEWQQLTYGQGEGEFLMLGCLFSVFWETPRRLVVEIDDGEIDAEEAREIVHRIGKKTFGESNFEVFGPES